MIKSYIRLKLLTGLRRGDLLRLQFSSLNDDGIFVNTQKNSMPLLIQWTKELKESVNQAVESRPTENSSFVFCTKTGDPYVKADGTASGFDSLWQRFMNRALKNSNLKEKFQEKDLRKKTANDMGCKKRKIHLVTHHCVRQKNTIVSSQE